MLPHSIETGRSRLGEGLRAVAIVSSHRWLQRSRLFRRRITPFCRHSFQRIPRSRHQASTFRSRPKVCPFPVSSCDQRTNLPRRCRRSSSTSITSPVRTTSGCPSAARASRSSRTDSVTHQRCRALISGDRHNSGSKTYRGRVGPAAAADASAAWSDTRRSRLNQTTCSCFVELVSCTLPRCPIPSRIRYLQNETQMGRAFWCSKHREPFSLS